MQNLAVSFRLGRSTVPYIVIEVCNAIWQGLVNDYVKFQALSSEWRAVAEGFFQRWNFPHCAIGEKHVIQAAHNTGKGFFNYKNTHSIVLNDGCGGFIPPILSSGH